MRVRRNRALAPFRVSVHAPAFPALRIDDFYHAFGTTTDGVDFALTFRDRRALSWLRKAAADD